MTNGHYCLIQFCADFGRAEGVNVGALVLRDEPAAHAVRVARDLDAIAKRIVPKISACEVADAAQAMGYRLRHERFNNVEELDHFVRTRGNQIQLTRPRYMRVEDLNADIDRIFDELVASPPNTQREPRQVAAVAKRLRTAFERLRAEKPDRVDIGRRFEIPDVALTIPSDYSYRNGRLNLVRILDLPKTEEIARREALALHSEGELVRDRLQPGAKLHVVAAPRTEREMENEAMVGRILEKLDAAEFVPSDKVDEFAERVEQEMAAH
jgi:hypothetical protein